MRKKAWFILAIISLIFLVSGCIDSTTVISVNGDGSGKIIETIGMNKEMAESMKSMMTMGQEDKGETSVQSVFKKEDFENKIKEYGEGVTLESFKTFEKGEGDYARAVYSFDDINKIRIKQGGDSSAPQAAPAEEQSYITFNLVKSKGLATLKIKMPEEKAKDKEKKADVGKGEPKKTPQPGELEMMKNMFKGLHFAAKVLVNGDITKTNATHVSGNTVTLFDVDFDKFLDNDKVLAELQKFENPQEAQEVFKKIEGVKFEPNKEIRISFKPGAQATAGLIEEEDVTDIEARPLGSSKEELFGAKAVAGLFAAGMVTLLIALAIGLIPVILIIWLFCRIFRKAGYSAALGLLMIFPFVNLIMLMMLAFIDWPIYEKFAKLKEEAPSPLDPADNSQEPQIELEKPLPLKGKRDKDQTSIDEPVLPLPSETEPKSKISDKAKGSQEPKIILNKGAFGSEAEEPKQEPKTPKPKTPEPQAPPETPEPKMPTPEPEKPEPKEQPPQEQEDKDKDSASGA